jgi:GNAT superfamily N-acetyltransferase
VEIARASTPAQLASVAAVTAVVAPDLRPTVEELEHVLASDPHAVLLLATRDGEPAGSGVGRASSVHGSLFAMVRVPAGHRRRGVGTALLEALRVHARKHGFESLWGRIAVGDEDSLRFAERRGFRETGREHEAVLVLDRDAGPVRVPDGVEIVSLAARPDLAAAAYDVEVETIDDIPVDEHLVSATFDRWHADTLEGPAALPHGCLVALAGGEVVGYAGLAARGADAATAEHLLTAVRRTWRGRGIATALKQTQIAWARGAGFERLVTWNDAPNAPMRALNEKLGYRSEPTSIHVHGAA